MIEEILLEDSVSRDGLRVLHVMGGAPVSAKWMDYVPDAAKASARTWEDEMNFHHLLVSWQAREVVTWTFKSTPWLEWRNVVMWYVEPGQKVSRSIWDAAVCYALNLGRDPLYAYVREIPTGAGEAVEVKGVMLVEVDWMPQNFVMLDNGGAERVPGFRVVRPPVAERR